MTLTWDSWNHPRKGTIKSFFVTCNNKGCRESCYFCSWFSLKWGVILNFYPTWTHPLKWADYFWVLVAHTLALLGYSDRGDWNIPFSKNPWNFYICHIIFGNSGENKASPQEIPQNCATTVANSKSKNQDPSKFHMIYFWLGENSPLFYLILGISVCSAISLEILWPHYLGFFWNSP